MQCWEPLGNGVMVHKLKVHTRPHFFHRAELAQIGTQGKSAGKALFGEGRGDCPWMHGVMDAIRLVNDSGIITSQELSTSKLKLDDRTVELRMLDKSCTADRVVHAIEWAIMSAASYPTCSPGPRRLAKGIYSHSGHSRHPGVCSAWSRIQGYNCEGAIADNL